MADKKDKKQKKAETDRASARGRLALNTRATQFRKVNRTLRAGGLAGLEQFLESPVSLQPGVVQYANAAACAFRRRQIGSRFKNGGVTLV